MKFPLWHPVFLFCALILLSFGALAQTQNVTVIYRWTAPTTYDTTPPTPLAATEITGYELKLNSGSVQVAPNVLSYSKTYTLAAGSCVTDIAQARVRAAIWSLWTDPLTVNLCPPSKLILQWTATVALSPTP
jgi:hypothetical protein